jgi:CheY-like chemotaxis protein
LVSDVVADFGHTPAAAANGAEAWKLFGRQAADVVISDWMMPRLDGAELCRLIRAEAGAPYTYFVMLTALGDSEHRLAGMLAGVDDYLPKPFDLEELQARLIAAERVTSLHRRREALLRQARRAAAEDDPERLLSDLVEEAVRLIGGTRGFVARWDEAHNVLVPVGPNAPEQSIAPGEGASGQAARDRVPVLVNDAASGAAVAVPLLHEGRLIGSLTVSSEGSDQTFTREDVELLEVLASTAASAMVALERARLDGVLLAARTAQHELNNQLAVARGYAELLVDSPDLPAHLAELAEEVKKAADDAARIVRQLRSIDRITEMHWPSPSDTTINLADSSAVH